LIMLLYYVIIGLLNPSWKFNLVYWPAGFMLAMLFTGKIWKRLKRLGRVTGREIKSSTLGRILIGLSWGLGFIIGWVLIPRLDPGVNLESNLATGFLTFIALSVLAMWLVFARFDPRETEREIIPAFLLPAIGIPCAMKMEAGAITWAGFIVALSFTLTILWYLYSAFKAIER